MWFFFLHETTKIIVHLKTIFRKELSLVLQATPHSSPPIRPESWWGQNDNIITTKYWVMISDWMCWCLLHKIILCFVRWHHTLIRPTGKSMWLARLDIIYYNHIDSYRFIEWHLEFISLFRFATLFLKNKRVQRLVILFSFNSHFIVATNQGIILFS